MTQSLKYTLVANRIGPTAINEIGILKIGITALAISNHWRPIWIWWVETNPIPVIEIISGKICQWLRRRVR